LLKGCPVVAVATGADTPAWGDARDRAAGLSPNARSGGRNVARIIDFEGIIKSKPAAQDAQRDISVAMPNVRNDCKGTGDIRVPNWGGISPDNLGCGGTGL